MSVTYPTTQTKQRARVFAAHQAMIDDYFDNDGRLIWRDGTMTGGYRGLMDHCLSFLAGNAACVERANNIIVNNFTDKPCHFAPGVAIDILMTYDKQLTAKSKALLRRLVEVNVPYMSTEDLKIHGYNDNHVHKAIHALIVGGEMLGDKFLVERGLFRLRQAHELFHRNGFPCEYNSPNYTPVSLQPLAMLVAHTKSDEACELALALEQFYWQDAALHFDPNVGLPTGPMTRCGDADATGLLGGTTNLVAYLFPERFAFDVVEEAFVMGGTSPLMSDSNKLALPFCHACNIWMVLPDYHCPPSLEETFFAKPVGTTVRGTSESGTSEVGWATDAERPLGAPDIHRVGPRNSLLTTYYGDGYTLGTSQYSWLNGPQTHSFYATVRRGGECRPQDAAVYYTRLYFDDHNPYGEKPEVTGCFKDQGDIRTIQREGTALVYYNPYPYQRFTKQIRTGVFRPLLFSRPADLWVGESQVASLNGTFDVPQPVAIDEGNVYVGIIPLAPNPPALSTRNANLVIHTRSTHLVIESTLYENWGPTDLSYEQIVETSGGFAFEIHPATSFGSFAAFRAWLAGAEISDAYYGRMRTTTYRREGLTLSTCYSPWSTQYRHASINGEPLIAPRFEVTGIEDPGFGV